MMIHVSSCVVSSSVVSSSVIDALGWSLLHFCWQGSLIAIVLALLFRFIWGVQRRVAAGRYVASGLALAAMQFVFMFTVALEFRSHFAANQPLITTRPGSPALSVRPAEDASSAVEVKPPEHQPFSAAEFPPVTPSISDSQGKRSADSLGLWSRFIAAIHPWMAWLVGGWWVGVAVMSLRLAGSYWVVARLRNRGRKLEDSAWQTRLAGLCRPMGVVRHVSLLLSDSISVPCVIGCIKPVILVPTGFLLGLSVEQVEAVLAHELAHIRRHDYWVNLWQNAVESLLFFHPAVWWVSRQMRVEREFCCDDLASSVAGGALPYSRALATLEALRSESPTLVTAADGSSLTNRIARLIGRSPGGLPRGGMENAMLIWTGLVLFVLAGVYQGADARNDETEAKKAKSVDERPKDEIANRKQKVRHEEVALVLKCWRDEYRERERLPHEAMLRFKKHLQQYIEGQPGPISDKLADILTRIEKPTEWEWPLAIDLLEEVANVTTAPVGWLGLGEEFRGFERPKPGRIATPEALAKLPFGEPTEDGLRVARVFDPHRDSYDLGSVLGCRIVFHNSGQRPIEFRSDLFHQDDDWSVNDSNGRQIELKQVRFSGITPRQRFKLQPNEVCEVSAPGVAIGAGNYQEQYSTGALGAELLVNVGDEVRCSWSIRFDPLSGPIPQPTSSALPPRLSTGELRFKVVAADPNAPQPPGVATFTGRYDLAPHVKLQVSQITTSRTAGATTRENTATLQWLDAGGQTLRSHKLDLPSGHARYVIVWPRGGNSLWIGQVNAVRRVRYLDVREPVEESFPWDSLDDFGSAPADVLDQLRTRRPQEEEADERGAAVQPARPSPIAQTQLENKNDPGPNLTKSAPSETGITLDVIDAETGAPIDRFQVVAGVRSSVIQPGEDAKESPIVNWQPHTLRASVAGVVIWPLERAYEEMALRVEADGRMPTRTPWISRASGAQKITIKLSRAEPFRGRVLTPEGKPASGAVVALAIVQSNAILNKGELQSPIDELTLSASDRWRFPRSARTNDDGRFELPAENDPTAAILISHDSGVAEMSLAEFRRATDVKLKPWARLEGRLQWNEIKGANREVSLSIHRETYGYPGIIAQYERVQADQEGKFKIERVLPGLVQLSCPITVRDANTNAATEVNLTGLLTHIEANSGSNRLLIGGQGRRVVGRLTGKDDWNGVKFHFHPTAPHFGFPGDEQHWAAWRQFGASEIGKYFFRDGLEVQEDGRWSIERLLPGDYQIFFLREGGTVAVYNGKIHVPAETEGDLEPIDLGEWKTLQN